MTDTFEHNPGDHEDPHGSATWLVGIVGTVIFIVLVMGVTAMLRATVAQTMDDVTVRKAPAELNEVIERDLQRLNAPPRIIEYVDVNDQPATRMTIPIDRAMELTAEQYSEAAANGTSGG